MIPDWETDTVYVADLLSKEYPKFYEELTQVLDHTHTPHRVILNTRDIWCRDYMPVQLSDTEYVQFTYQPDYLYGSEELITPVESRKAHLQTPIMGTPLVLDGGNLVASDHTIILTDKVYKENPKFTRTETRRILAQILRKTCQYIPKQPYDWIGHADGVVRWVNNDTVVINDYTHVDPSYGQRLTSQIHAFVPNIVIFPYHYQPNRQSRSVGSAVGNYTNYLRTKHGVILPAYQHPNDDVARRKAEELFPDTPIHQIDCRSIAEQGGVINCCTWTIKN
jgi:agmatine deiminase